MAGVLGLPSDITERKQAEEELQAAYQRNETVLATSMDGFLTMGPDGTIGDCNKAFCEMVGYSRDELLAMKITDLDAVEAPEEIAQHIKEVMEAGGMRLPGFRWQAAYEPLSAPAKQAGQEPVTGPGSICCQ